MVDREKFIEELRRFFEKKQSVVLITGLDDTEKTVQTFCELEHKYTKGTIYVNVLKHVGDVLNQKFGYKNKIFPRKISRSTRIDFGNMTLDFDKYSENEFSSFSKVEDEFALYFPIQSALKNDKNTTKLIEHIKFNKTPKKILLTTNDIAINISKLEPVIDTHIHYEVKNDNPRIYENTRRNLKNKSENDISSIYKGLII